MVPVSLGTLRLRATARMLLFLMAICAFTSETTTVAASQPFRQSEANLPSREDARSSAAVYWVGHSLVEGKVPTSWGEMSLMTFVGRFAEVRGLRYSMGDHTLWGSPLSALWRGQPHGYTRDASSMVEKRVVFQRTAAEYDTLVLTEAIPVQSALRIEYSPYYVRQFYCALLTANPVGRVYLYQTWVSFQGSDPYSKFPPPHRFDWRAEMIQQRKHWDELALSAAQKSVRVPGWLERFGWTSTSNAGCDLDDPIRIIPAGDAFVALSELLASGDQAARPKLLDGRLLAMADLFANPYVDWPSNWPTQDDAEVQNPTAIVHGLRRRDPSKPHDDIHLSALGVYFVSLVHFATIYRQSPLDLPAPAEIGDDVARVLQCVAWRTVVNEPRSGVRGNETC